MYKAGCHPPGLPLGSVPSVCPKITPADVVLNHIPKVAEKPVVVDPEVGYDEKSAEGTCK